MAADNTNLTDPANETALSAAAEQLEAYLAAQDGKDLLRFITCGSVDDGKSTLIGRLLYDSKLLFDDQLASLETESKRFGTTGPDALDLALLVDGLAAEREQGITIDVAYRFFATDKRKFIVADTPGHEQYTRNMVTGASTAQTAVLLVDARKGILTQTRRHSTIVSLLGIRHVILAINKMDLVGWDETVAASIEEDYRRFAADIGITDIACIPLSALTGGNVTIRSEDAAWYQGPTLLEHLETIVPDAIDTSRPFRLPIQWVNRPHLDFRGFSGTIASGTLCKGDPVVVLPSGLTSKVDRIVTMDGDLKRAVAGQAVTVTLTDEIDVSRGDVIAAPDTRPEVSDQFGAHIVWMDEDQLFPGRRYALRTATTTADAQITDIKYKLNVNTQEHIAAKTLHLNDVAACNLSLNHPIAFDPYGDNPTTGSFILIDRLTNATVGCGMIDFALRRASNIHWQATKVDKAIRAKTNRQTPCVLWFTGLSGAGKSTVADLVEQKLQSIGRHTMLLDGDNVRHGLNRDLGFTDQDRVENIRRVGEVSRLMTEAGLITLVSFISPFRSERRMARDLVQEHEFIEVFVDAPLDVCETRDVKGLYQKARSGAIPNFTGISSPYEPPESPDIHLRTDASDAHQCADLVIAQLRERGII